MENKTQWKLPRPSDDKYRLGNAEMKYWMAYQDVNDVATAALDLMEEVSHKMEGTEMWAIGGYIDLFLKQYKP